MNLEYPRQPEETQKRDWFDIATKTGSLLVAVYAAFKEAWIILPALALPNIPFLWNKYQKHQRARVVEKGKQSVIKKHRQQLEHFIELMASFINGEWQTSLPHFVTQFQNNSSGVFPPQNVVIIFGYFSSSLRRRLSREHLQWELFSDEVEEVEQLIESFRRIYIDDIVRGANAKGSIMVFNNKKELTLEYNRRCQDFRALLNDFNKFRWSLAKELGGTYKGLELPEELII